MDSETYLMVALADNLEELHVTKQLPFRAQTAKPILKYSNSEPGPIYLYQNPDVSPIQKVSSVPTSPARSVVEKRHTDSSCKPKVNSKSQKQSSVAQYNGVPTVDPYARPLSAKNLMTVGIDRPKNSTVGTRTKNASNDIATHMHSTNLCNSNIFKQNDSGLQSQTKIIGTLKTNSSNSMTATKVISIQSPSSMVTQTAKEKFEASLQRPSSTVRLGMRPPSALRSPLPSQIRNPNYSPTKPYQEVSKDNSDEFKMVSDPKPNKEPDTLNGRVAKAITTLSRSKTSIAAEKSSSNNKVDEINDSNKVCENIKTDSSANDLPLAQSGAKSLGSATTTPVGSAGSMRSSTSSSYYLKSVRPEVKIAEPRSEYEGRDKVSPTTSNAVSPSKSSTESPSNELDEGDGDTESNMSDRGVGDDEAEDDDFYDDEEDGIDELDDDELEGDDESDNLSCASSRRSGRIRSASVSRVKIYADPNAPIRMKSARRRTHSSYGDQTIQPALTKSLFPNVPPYLNFITESEKMEQLPWEYRKLLKWRLCSITPNVVRQCVARSGFRQTKKHYDWLGCWGKHMKAQGFKSIRSYQKLNHFPGSFQIGRKDRLWRNLSKLQIQHGKKEFNFIPTTYVLPFDMKGLKRAWDDGGGRLKWIIKPPASARGIGIKVINKWNQIPKKRPVVVQKYLARPLLINGAKFDCRIYVYVTSYDPLRIYVYEDGLVRFCSTKYSHSMKHINNKYMHLTNYSIQKKNDEYESNQDDTQCQGHKWSLKALWGYLLRKGVNTNEIWKSIKDLIVKTILSAESSINSFIKANVHDRYSVHELFGFDILLDDSYQPWVLEVNISPSLHSNSQLDINIKGGMVKDLHNLAGFRIPDRNDVMASPSIDSYKNGPPSNRYCIDRRLSSQSMSADEKAKHAYFCQRYQDESVLCTIADVLTPDDLRILVESIDEDSRKGGFQRIFPTPSTSRYLRYFDAPRYYNLLLDQWCQKYNRIEAQGIALIEAACRNKIHLQNPTTDPRYQWSPPSSSRLNISLSTTSISSAASANGLPKLRRSPSRKPTDSSMGRPPLPLPARSTLTSAS